MEKRASERNNPMHLKCVYSTSARMKVGKIFTLKFLIESEYVFEEIAGKWPMGWFETVNDEGAYY